jgi:hypothetical protein
MEKSKKIARATPVKTKETITDQSTGPQQLYEDPKVKPSTKSKSISIDPKKVRQHANVQINKLLGVKASAAKQQKLQRITLTKRNK